MQVAYSKRRQIKIAAIEFIGRAVVLKLFIFERFIIGSERSNQKLLTINKFKQIKLNKLSNVLPTFCRPNLFQAKGVQLLNLQYWLGKRKSNNDQDVAPKVLYPKICACEVVAHINQDNWFIECVQRMRIV